MSQTLRKALPYLALAAIVVGVVNFFWFIAESERLGGDALGGYVQAGRYYVGSHGSYTEVGQAAWEWSRLHALSVFLTHLAAMVSMAYLLLGFIFPAAVAGRGAPENARERADLVRASGPVIASDRVAGQIGAMRFSGPLLHVSVFPAGLVIKPTLMSEHAILASEIRAVNDKPGLLGHRSEVMHDGVGAASPLVVYASPDSPLIRAIQQVAGRPRSEPSMQRHPGQSETAPSGSWLTAPDRVPAGIMPALNLLGVAVGIVLIAMGIVWAIPQLGPFGLAWTGFAVLITASNIRRVLMQRR